MGKRGPGAGRLRAAAANVPATVKHPWEKRGMPPEEQVLAFLRSLPIVAGLKAGERMELLDFQEDFVRAVYAPLDFEGRRVVRQAVLSIARGNGKTGLLSGIGLAHLLGPMSEPHGEVYAAALDREQSGIMFKMSRAYIEATPWMAARVNVRDWHKSITDEETQSTWTALTSDVRKAHGLAPSFWMADEVAQWKSRELWDNLTTGMGKRAQALGVTISTQAKDDLHFFSELLDAEPDPTVHVQLHAAPDDCALDDREAWAAANPALGHFRDLKEFEIAAERSMRMRSFEPAFRLLYLNQRVDGEVGFIAPADWEANGERFDPTDLEGEICFGGLDLSSTRDLTALALWFPEQGCLLAWHWLPEDTIREREERDRVPYGQWADDGLIETTVGRATDRVAIARQLAEIRERFDVQGIAYDRWRFEDLAKLLADEGIELPMVEFVPGFKSYAAAVDAFERAVLERRLLHNGSPLLRWQASNVIVETDPAGNRKPSKAKSADKIDGIVAAIMACGLAATMGPDDGESHYESASLLVI
jgi:phage terminase large subunit-like protein